MITNVVAVPMILAGKYLDKVYNGATISDVGDETRNTVDTLNDVKEQIK